MPNDAVIALQCEASKSDADVSGLLRNAFVIASKLSLHDTSRWIESELKGYEPESSVPKYRHLPCELRVFNPFNGVNMPVLFSSHDEGRKLSEVKIKDSIPSLQHLLQNNQEMYFNFAPGVAEWMMNQYNYPSPPRRHINKSSVQNILTEVQNIILQWALDLETAGILGGGLVFSQHEKEAATFGPTITVTGGNVNVVGINHGLVNTNFTLASLMPQVNASSIPEHAKKEFGDFVHEWDTYTDGDRKPLQQKIKIWLVDNLVGLGSLGLQISEAIAR